MPGTVLGAEDSSVNGTDKNPGAHGAASLQTLHYALLDPRNDSLGL